MVVWLALSGELAGLFRGGSHAVEPEFLYRADGGEILLVGVIAGSRASGENALGRRAKLEGVGSFDCVSLAFRAGLTSVQDDIG